MTYVVVELCVDCKYTDCAAVCPVEAFHELTDRLYINADTCIDCDACVPECPVEAIFQEIDVPEKWSNFIAINAERTAALIASGDGLITEKKDAKEGPGCNRNKRS